MSLNALIPRKYLPEIAGYKILLQKFSRMWSYASSLEQRLEIETEALGVFEKLLALVYELEDVTQFDHPDLADFTSDFDRAKYFSAVNIAKIKALSQMYLEAYNNQQLSILELTGKIRRAKQKKAVLSLWDDNLFKHVAAEGFFNLDALDTSHSSGSRCWVNTVQGTLTLPKSSSSKKFPKKVKIGSSSNGQPGNSDEDVTTNNIKPSFMLDGNPDTWFEYEKLDAGPLKLSAICEFSQPTIVNELIVTPAALGTGVDFEIVDVFFNIGGGKEITLRELVRGTVPEEFWTVKTIGNDFQWSATFLPVKCQEVTIKFKQEHSYVVRTATNDGRTASRTRYSLGIKSLYFNQTRFEASGGINSTETDLPGSLYACVAYSDIFPNSKSLFKANLDVSFNGGETWEIDVLGMPNSESRSLVLAGNESSFIWRLQLTRNDDAFQTVNSYSEEDVVYDTESISRGVSKLFSPARIPLVEQPYNNEVFVMQPKLLTRTTKLRDAVVIGRTGGAADGEKTFSFPIDIIEEDIDPDDIHIWVNGFEWTRVEDEADLASTFYKFTENYERVVFFGLSEHSTIKVSMDPERMLIAEESDGYYHKMNHLFDPTKERIKIEGLNDTVTNKTIILTRGVTRINLKYRNIIDDTVEFVSSEGNTYTAVSSRSTTDLTAAGQYFLDAVNGMLYLYEGITTDIVTLKFQYQGVNQVSSESFDIIMDKVIPWGVRIAKDALVAETLTDTVGGSRLSLIDITTGSVMTRISSFSASSTAETLSRDYIIKGSVIVGPELFGRDEEYNAPTEVTYVDGYTEFLGLYQMDNETTVGTDAGGDGLVTFTLAAASAYYSPLGITFDDSVTFVTRETSLGDVSGTDSADKGKWYIDGVTGVVTVNVGAHGVLPDGISIYYSYRDPSFDSTNLFSVDYKTGILYSSESMVSGSKIKYKASNYMVSYQIGAEIDNYNYSASSNTVTVGTEGLSDLNSRVKIIWAKSPVDSSIEEMREYFSPLLNSISLRFE